MAFFAPRGNQLWEVHRVKGTKEVSPRPPVLYTCHACLPVWALNTHSGCLHDAILFHCPTSFDLCLHANNLSECTRWVCPDAMPSDALLERRPSACSPTINLLCAVPPPRRQSPGMYHGWALTQCPESASRVDIAALVRRPKRGAAAAAAAAGCEAGVVAAVAAGRECWVLGSERASGISLEFAKGGDEQECMSDEELFGIAAAGDLITTTGPFLSHATANRALRTHAGLKHSRNEHPEIQKCSLQDPFVR
eukprot:753197-Pelagomonas_calceolata.AAC.1